MSSIWYGEFDDILRFYQATWLLTSDCLMSHSRCDFLEENRKDFRMFVEKIPILL
jgi:hypothetical protein